MGEGVVLEAWDMTAFDLIVDAAERGKTAPTADDIVEAVGCSSNSTPSKIVRRLERQGLIRVDRYQRTRRIFIIATGKATAEVTNKTPHWRTKPRPRSMPSVSVTYIQQRRGDMAAQMLEASRAERLTLQDFIAELVWSGWLQREATLQAVEG